MTKLIITRGYPGSGKTTWGRAKAAELHGIYVDRDSLRQMMYGRDGVLELAQENEISKAERAIVEGALKAGRPVVVGDMHMRLRYARAWADLAIELGVEFECVDFRVSAEDCIARDVSRWLDGGRQVGESAIRGIAEKFPLKQWPPVTPSPDKVAEVFQPYTPDPDRDLMPAYIFDLDGTLALNRSGRSPYDMTRVCEDDPNPGVVAIAHELQCDNVIIVVSGRDSSALEMSKTWLNEKCFLIPHRMFMRAEGDTRKDSVVKNEIFEREIAPYFHVLGVFDDRNQVVDMWRAKGLPCFQVADGDF